MLGSNAPEGKEQIILVVPFALFLSLVILYAMAVPTGESPDEPGHLQCIEQVSLLNQLPETEPRPQGDGAREFFISGRMCYHMPLYYVISGYLQRISRVLTNSSIHFEFPPNNPKWGASPAMFTAADKQSLLSILDPPSILVLRLASALLGLVMLWASYRIATIAFPGKKAIAVLAAAFVAGWPQFIFMSRAINNDVLATALVVVVFVLLLEVSRPRRFLLASLLAGLAILTKVNMIFGAVAVLVVLFVETLTFRDRRNDYIASGLGSGLILTITILLIVLQPTLRAHVIQSWNSFSGVTPDALTAAYWLDVLKLTLSSGWARFGWMNVPAPTWQAYAWWVFIMIGCLLGIRSLLLDARKDVSRRLIILVLLIWAVVVTASYLRINANRFQPQFRFALALLPLFASLSAAGFLKLFDRNPQLQWAAVASFLVMLLLVNIWIVLRVIVPAYT